MSQKGKKEANGLGNDHVLQTYAHTLSILWHHNLLQNWKNRINRVSISGDWTKSTWFSTKFEWHF